MRKRSSTNKDKGKDVNQLAANIVEAATGAESKEPKKEQEKDPAAVSLGRRGGKRGGPARARKLTPEQRKEIAKKAAEARWKK